jgi:hypothetical protein
MFVVMLSLPRGLVNLQHPQRANMHFELDEHRGDSAQTLRRVARNMAGQTIVDRLEAVANDYERRAEKASLADSELARPPARREPRGGSQE